MGARVMPCMPTFGACAAPPVQAHHSALAARGASHSDEPRLQGELGGYAFCARVSAPVMSVTKAWQSFGICCTISCELEAVAALLG